MATKNKEIIPARAIHPGEILKEELKEREITQKEFAKLIGMQATHLNEVIKGKRNINEEMAIKLEKQLQIPYHIWMNLQNSYHYDCKAIHKRSIREENAAGKTESPTPNIAELLKAGANVNFIVNAHDLKEAFLQWSQELEQNSQKDSYCKAHETSHNSNARM